MTSADDALALLTSDHESVEALFEQFEGLSDRSKVSKKKIAGRICKELAVHATVAEEIFYPAVHAHIKDDDMMGDRCAKVCKAKIDLVGNRYLTARCGGELANGTCLN